MEYISTTALANGLDVKPSELFDKLKTLGLIEKNGDKWTLTVLGKQKGGQTRVNPKFGEFVVWPENISFGDEKVKSNAQFINTTTIAKHFGISSQRMNLILSERGWVEKTVAGWEITKLGKQIGGRQFESDQGFTYVTWPESILQNKYLTSVFKETPVINDANKSANEIKESQNSSDNFRQKYPANLRTQDGHFVRSKSEVIIDNWLYISGLVHSYEKKLPVEEDVVSDFYIPSGNGRPQSVYIEYWGLEHDPKYQDRMKKKIEIYKANDFNLIELTDKDIENIDDVLPRKLLQFKIKIGA